MYSTLLVIIILTSINALFAASEMALVSIKPSTLYQIKKNGYKNSGVLDKVIKDSTKYLSTIQVAITLSGFLSSAIAGSQLSDNLVRLFARANITIPNNVAVIIITILLSFFTLVFGELVPKRVALSKSIKIALLFAPVIYFFMKVFTPFVWLLTVSTKSIVRLFGIKHKQEDGSITEKDIKEMIVYGHIEGLYNKQEKDMMERIFMFDDLSANEIMTPINNVTSINIELADEETINKIIESKYSRIPVYKDHKDNIQGIIMVKDIVNQVYNHKKLDIKLNKILRKPFIVPSDIKINKLFMKMKEKKYHFAFITNDNDEVLGIVTLEDILEQIVGDIFDEHDK